MRRPATVRGRTTLLATGVVALALAVAGCAFVLLLQRTLTRNIDDTLAARADDVTALLAAGASPTQAMGSRRDDFYVQLVGPDQKVLASSSTEPESPLLTVPPSSGRPMTASDLPIGEEGEDFRVTSRTVQTPSGPTTLTLAASLEPVEQTLSAAVPQLLIGLPALLAVVGLTTWYMTGRALRPVSAIRRQLAAISSQDLAARVPEPPTRDEIAELARMMNGLLGRLEAAHAQQQRFIADASHELRGPLTTLRTKAEIAIAHPERTDWPHTTTTWLHEIERLCALVEDLLVLARTSDAPERQRDDVDLGDLLLLEVERLQERGSRRVEIGRVDVACVRGDRGALGRLLHNLGANADRHARGRVRLHLQAEDGVAVLDVDDDGPGIPVPDRERVFERFVRLDDTRTRSTGGSGLGLAIARELAAVHDGTLVVGTNEWGGARLRLRLPLQASDFPAYRVSSAAAARKASR
ncbi:MAG: hypothetical protein QOC98_2127 [Frankiaceae bacterium]|nr:hypothetical protein [Frankiaceae bacterium]